MVAGNDNVIQGAFHALGHAGSDSYIGLEIIDLEDVMDSIAFHSDEFTAVCPVTGQPDQYELTIELDETLVSIESKSLKLYLGKFRNQGCFAENLAIGIRKEVCEAIEKHVEDSPIIFHQSQVTVTIVQKRRGGIEIAAVASER